MNYIMPKPFALDDVERLVAQAGEAVAARRSAA
jgi:hypothetical protein